MSNQRNSRKKADLLVGRWTCVDQWQTEIALVIEKRGEGFRVRAIDQSDGEKAEVFDVKSTGGVLSFATYWSSGQFTKYRVRAVSDDQIEAIYTYTNTTRFKRVSNVPMRTGTRL